MNVLLTAAAVAAAAAPSAATDGGPAPAAAQPVVVVVDVPTPPGVTDALIRAQMEKTVPQYQALPGLIRKYFTIAPGHFGGVYYWSSRAAAEAWFNDAWKARVVKTYGAPAEIRYYDAPIAVEGQRP